MPRRAGFLRSHLSSHISGVPQLIFEVERAIERSFSQLYNTTVLIGTPANGVCVCQMQIIVWVMSYILWGAKKGGFFRAISQDSHNRFSKLNGRLKGLSLSNTSLLVKTPSNGACVRQMKIIARVTPYILWGAKTRWVLTMSGRLPSHISGFPRPILKVERLIERSLSQLHVSTGHNPDNWRMRPSSANHCPSDVIHTLEMGLSHVQTVT